MKYQRGLWSVVLLTSCMVFLTARAAPAAVVSWTGAAGDGKATTAGNWNTGAVPGVNDDAAITLAGTYTVTLDSDATVKSLTLGGTSGTQTLTIASGKTLTLTGGTSAMNAQGVITVNGNVTVANGSTFNWTGGTLQGNGTATIASGAALNLSGSDTKTMGCYVNNSGTTTWTGAGTISGGPVFNNQSGGVFDIQNDASFGPFQAIINAGTFKKTGRTSTSSITVVSGFTNSGTIADLAANTEMQFSGPLTNNAGTFNAPSSTLTIMGTFTSTGASVVQAGTLNLINGGSSTGSLTLGSGVVFNNMSTTTTHTLIAPMSITGPGVYRVNGGSLSNSGAVSVQNLDLMAALGAAGTMQGTVSGDVLTVTGVMNSSGGSINGPSSGGALDIASGAVVNINNFFPVNLNRNLNNSGTITWAGPGDINGGRVTFNNQSGGVFDIQNDATFGIQAITNAGTFKKTGGTGTSTIYSGGFTNSGTVTDLVTNTTLYFNALFTNNAGTLNAPSSTITMQSSFTSTGASVVQTGTLNLINGGSSTGSLNLGSGVIVANAGLHTLTAPMSITGPGVYRVYGSLSNSGAVTVQNLDLVSGTLSTAPATQTHDPTSDVLTVTGMMNFSGGSINGPGSGGALDIASGAVVNINNILLPVNLNRNLNNSGTITWTGTGYISSGGSVTFNNQSGGVFDIQNDATFAIQAITNAGTFKKTGGTGTSTIYASGGFTNSGTVTDLVTNTTLYFNAPFTNNAGTLNAPSSTINLQGTFTSTGASVVQAGTLNLQGGGSSTGSLALGTGAVVNSTSNTAHILTAPMSITGAGTYRVNGGALSNSGAVTVQNLDVVSGTLSTTPPSLPPSGTHNDVSDVLRIAGTLNWTGGTASGPQNGGSLDILSGATLNLSGTGNRTLNRNLNNAGTIIWTDGGSVMDQSGRTFTNQPSGIVQINALVTWSMTTINNVGTLRIQAPTGGSAINVSCATFVNSGIMDLKSGGGLPISGAFSQTSAGSMNFTLNGTSPGTNYCPVSGSNISLDGTLNVSLASGYTPLDGNTYSILIFGGSNRNGDFATKNLPGLSAGLLWSSAYTTTPTATLTLTATSGLIISSITPNTAASSAGTVTTTISGVHLPQGATAKLTKTGQTDITGAVSNVSTDGTQMTVAFNLTGAASGYWSVVVAEASPGTRSSTLTDGFGINVLGVNSITPNLGRVGTQVLATIKGSGFAIGTTVQLSRGLQTISGTVQVIDTTTTPQTITATFLLPPQGSNPSPLGKWDVVITNTDGKFGKLAQGFTIYDAPVITSISPTWAYWDETVTLTIKGANFANGATVKLSGWLGGDRTASSVAFSDSTQIAATFNLASPFNASQGLYTVTVINPDGGQAQLPVVFTVQLPPATITSITPNSALNTGSVTVTLVGSNFLTAVTLKLTKDGQADITPTNTSVNTDFTQLTVTLDLTGAASGTWNVVVTTAGQLTKTVANGFTVNALGAPTIASISPNNGTNNGTVTATITGTNFLSGTTTAKLTQTNQTDIAGTVTNVSTDGTQMTVTFNLNGAATGQWNVVVSNPSLPSAALPNGFSVNASPPPSTSINIGLAGNQYSLVSLPDVPNGFNAFGGLLDNNRNSYLVRWNAQKASDATYFKYEYLISGGTAANLQFSQVEAGRGYWRKASAVYTASFTGQTGSFDWPVFRGSDPNSQWNLIGPPYTSSVDLGTVQVVTGATTQSFDNAIAAGIVSPYVWRYREPTHGYELITTPLHRNDFSSVAGTSLDPGLGYWMRAQQDCALHYVAPGAAPQPGQLSAVRRKGTSWSVQLRVQSGNCRDDYNYFGTTSVPRALVKPPLAPDGDYVTLSFVDSAETSRSVPTVRQAAALRQSDARAANTWDFVVETNLSREVEVSWPNLASAPKDVRFYLKDLDANRRIYMRTQSAYRFQPAGVQSRRFRITAAVGAASALRVSSLSIHTSPTRSATEQSLLTFVLSQAADVQVRLVNASGRIVSQAQLPGARSGLNSIPVALRSARGFVLPRGYYVCEIVTTTAEGESVKSVKGFAIR